MPAPLLLTLAVVIQLAASVAAGLAQETPPGPADPVVEPGAPIADVSDPGTDRTIQRRLEQLFAAVDGLGSVRAQVTGGVATLSGRTTSAQLMDTAEALARRVEGVALVENQIEVTGELRLEPVWQRVELRLRSTLAFLPLLALGLGVFALVWLASGTMVHMLRPALVRTRNAFVGDLAGKIIRVAFVLAGAVIALDIMEATAVLGSLIGAAGLAGLALGFALRDTIENSVASVLLSLRQPFAPDDLVMIDGIEGVVVRLTSRATVLMTLDGNHVRVPNATVFKGTITNFTRNPERRFTFLVGVGTAVDLTTAREVALTALDRLDAVLKQPGPMVLVQELGDWSVVLLVAGWVDQRDHDFLKTRSEAIRLVKAAYDAAGIEMPVPVSTVHAVSAQAESGVAGESALADTATHPDTGKDDAIGRKAAADRADAAAPNLLRPDAPQE